MSREYVRIVQGSDLTGNGSERYHNVEVFDPPSKTWRTVRSCSDLADAKGIKVTIDNAIAGAPAR